MSTNRRFHGEPVSLLVVRVPTAVVKEIDGLLRDGLWQTKHPARGNRSEFVRMAIADRLKVDAKQRGR